MKLRTDILHLLAIAVAMVSLFLSCADDMGVEGVLPGGDAQQKGEMVRFAAGTTTNQVNSRAGSGLNETPGENKKEPPAGEVDLFGFL